MQTVLTPIQLEVLAKNCHLLYYDNLVLNVSNFNHPGGSHYISSKLGTNIHDIFQQTGHSLNAKLMLRDMVIGRAGNQPLGSHLFTDQEMKTVNTFDCIKQKLNLQKPIADQVSKFTRQEFMTFINYPKFIKNGQQVQVNNDPRDDLPDRTQFWINIPILSVIWVILLFLSISRCHNIKNVLVFGICFLVAVLKWTIIEYYFHRIKLHKQLNLVETATSQEFVKLAKSHLIHHAFPNYPKSIVVQFKTIFSHIAIISGIYYLMFGTTITLFMVNGLIFCVTIYDCLHYFFHFGWQPSWQFLKRLKRNHLKHHYKDTGRGFGVTNTIWDKIFGTEHK